MSFVHAPLIDCFTYSFGHWIIHCIHLFDRSFLAGTAGEPAAAHALPQLHERQLRQAEGLDRQDHQGRIHARQRIRGRTVIDVCVTVYCTNTTLRITSVFQEVVVREK